LIWDFIGFSNQLRKVIIFLSGKKAGASFGQRLL
jgi:hypothetical protein